MSGQLYRKLVEEFSDIPTIINSDGTMTYVSPSVTRTLGYEPEELIGDVGYEYQHTDDRVTVADAIERIQANPDSIQIIETRFRHADGSWVWIEATLQNRLDDPDINGILVNSRDISQRKNKSKNIRNLPKSTKCFLRLPRIIFSSLQSNQRLESMYFGSNA